MFETDNARETSSTRRFQTPVSLRAACAAVLAGGALATGPGVASATIAQRTTATTITLPAALEAASTNFCTWGFCNGFSPRLYQAPMADGRTLIGWTDANGNGHVSRVNGATIEQTFDFSATWLRGLVVHPDNSFAVLLEVNPTAAPPTAIFQRVMEIQLLTATGIVQWTTQLPNTAMIGLTPGAAPDSNEIGDSRLTYGNGQYAAYFAIRAEPDATNTEHNLDQLSFVSDAGVFSTTTGWGFGVSHSLAQLVDYQPTLQSITALAVSDCYPQVANSNPPAPQPGLYADHTNLLQINAGNCGGSSAMQLGQMVATTGGSWLVAFSGQSEPAETVFGFAQPAYVGKGIGLQSFNAGTYAPSAVTWLTNTDGTDERDPVLARIGTSLSSNRFLIGWRLQNEGTFNMEVTDPNGNVLNPLETVSPATGWGNRDDSLKIHPDSSITWLQGAGGATTLQMYRYYEVAPARDFNGTRTSDILWRNLSSGDAVIWLMQNGKLTSSTDLGVVDPSWSIVGSGDFNGDGTQDILWRNTNGDAVVWLMNGGTHSGSTDLGVVPAATWSIVGSGDFNGDGTTDILWRNTATGDVVVWFMQNGKLSSSTDLGSIPAAWSVAGTPDFNGDGTNDILWRNTSSGDTVVWFMKSGVISTSSDLGFVDPAAWTVAATGDFNGDGKADILWRNTSGEAVIWFSNGTSVTAAQDLGNVPTTWSIAGTGDYNGDATTDILWRNSSGDVVTWFMQNGTLSTSADLGVVPAAWAITSPAVQ